MRRGRAAAACAVLASAGWAAAALAAPSRVLVIRERAADTVVERAEVRLVAELRAAGFEVDERVVDAEADARRLVEQPDEGGSVFATVLLQRAASGASTDVWVADHVTHKTVVRRMNAADRGDAADRSLALRIVELMRASLVEALVLPPKAGQTAPSLAAPVSPSPSPPPLPADVARWTREALLAPPPAPTSLRLSIGVAGAFAGPAMGMAFAPEVAVAFRPVRAFSIGLLAAGPAFGARARGSQGSADIRQELGLLEGGYEGAIAPPVRAFVVAGAGAYHLDATGSAVAPFTSARGDTWSALLDAGLGLRIDVGGAASLVIDARELFAAPRPVVAFASDRVATAMTPGTLVGVALAVEL